MQIYFVRWCIDPKGRTPVSIDPTRVDATEHFSDAFEAATGESFPAATKVIMKGKQEYIVQGTVARIVAAINQEDKTMTQKRTIELVRQADLLACPHCILVASHYRENGTCKCDDAGESIMAEWGYHWNEEKGRWL